MTVADALERVSRQLSAAGVPNPDVDAAWLVAHVAGITRSALVTERGRELTAAETARLGTLAERRARREPLGYVLGEWGFRRLTLKIDRRALVPRPETETLVERCLVRLEGVAAPRVLDVGVGSGAIALALADEHPGARVTAIDVSDDALALAAENAKRIGLEIALLPHDVTDGLPGRDWDLVVSNPPYVPPDELELAEPEVRDWEPRAALVASGLHETIAQDAFRVLREGGWLALEVGDGQAGMVSEALRRLGYADVTITRDLSGRERVVEGRR